MRGGWLGGHHDPAVMTTSALVRQIVRGEMTLAMAADVGIDGMTQQETMAIDARLDAYSQELDSRVRGNP